MNKWESFLKKEGHTIKEFAELEADKMAELTAKFQMEQVQEISDAVENKATKEEVSTLITDALKDMEGVTKAKMDELEQALKDQGEALTEMKESTATTNVDVLAKEIKENLPEIKSIADKTSNGKEVVLKADTVRASIASNTESVRLAGIGQLGVKQRALYDYFSKFPVGDGNHNGTISYIDWDEATSVRAAAAVAEGAAFPESTAKFAEYTKKLIKVGDTLPVSEEFGEDEVLAAAELNNFLSVNVNTVIDNKIAVGAGGATDIEGLVTAAPAYTAVASGIADANIKDLVRKMRTAIVKTRGSKYAPNFVAANSDVIDQHILKKDANNNYMFDMNTGTIAGLDIVEDNNLADDTLVVGDGRFGRIYEKSGVVISEGMVDAQFTSDMKTIKARARLLFLVRTVDKTGFLKSTGIAADLATLAT